MSQNESTNKFEEIETSELISTGRSALAKNQIPEALENLQAACHRLSKEHGEMSEKMIDVYIYYGIALLAMSRVESGVLGNALSGIIEKVETTTHEVADDEGHKDKDWEQISEKVIDAMVEKDDITEEECEEELAEAEEPEKEEEPIDSTVEGEEKKEEIDEDLSHLQLSWEILELTRKILEKLESKQMQQKLTKVYLLLGEISVETASYDQAISDFTKCLDLRIKLEPGYSRLIAEVNYHIGLAYSYAKQYDGSLKFLSKSVEIMNKNVEFLSKNAQENSEEITDIKIVLPQMIQKIKDVEDERDQKSTEDVENGVSNGSKVDDITHTLKKKKDIESGVVNKKIKVDGEISTNGENAMKV